MRLNVQPHNTQLIINPKVMNMTTQSYFPKTEADRIIWLLQSWYPSIQQSALMALPL